MNKKKLLDKTGGYCFLCGTKVENKDLTREHVQPKSKGGKGADNIQPAHYDCNQEKGSMTLIEYCEKINRDKLEARDWQINQLLTNQR